MDFDEDNEVTILMPSFIDYYYYYYFKLHMYSVNV